MSDEDKYYRDIHEEEAEIASQAAEQFKCDVPDCGKPAEADAVITVHETPIRLCPDHWQQTIDWLFGKAKR